MVDTVLVGSTELAEGGLVLVDVPARVVGSMELDEEDDVLLERDEEEDVLEELLVLVLEELLVLVLEELLSDSELLVDVLSELLVDEDVDVLLEVLVEEELVVLVLATGTGVVVEVGTTVAGSGISVVVVCGGSASTQLAM